jgi:hypothetical protein
LREWPVTSITTVKQRDANNDLGDALDSDGYNCELDTGILYLTGTIEGRYSTDGWGIVPNFGYGRKRVQVVYVGNSSTPAGLVGALHMYIDHLFGRPKGTAAAMKSESVGDYSYTRADAAPAGESVLKALREELFDEFRGGTL